MQIGKTSAVVLTMAGILKDILLVAASMIIFRDPVTAQQFFGYSIALGGLCYYKLGGEKMQQAVTEAKLGLASVRQNHPARAKAALLGLVFGFVVLGMMFWRPNLPIAPVVTTPSG